MPIFVVDARPTGEALARVVLLLHRLRAPIESLWASYDEAPGLLRVEIAIPETEERLERIESNLYKIVDVLLVERKSGDAEEVPNRKTGGWRKP
jgi:acetolactate synthase small subunit